MAATNQMEVDVGVSQTFVFLDIEKTGKPEYANITELAMWIISREDLISDEEPRLLNKWTMCFNTEMVITENNKKYTGLDNKMLEKYNKFDENAGKALISYLSHFPKPVCLVAHYGSKHDFPIIKKSLENIALVMPDFIFCCDSKFIIEKLDEHLRLPPATKPFKLENLHRRIFGTDPDVAHQAEADVRTLYKIVKSNYRSNFIEASDNKRIRFSEISPDDVSKVYYY